MSELIAEAEIAERLDASTLTGKELATALAGLEARYLVRNLRPGLAPLWRLTPTGREALDQHRALHGAAAGPEPAEGAGSHSSPMSHPSHPEPTA